MGRQPPMEREVALLGDALEGGSSRLKPHSTRPAHFWPQVAVLGTVVSTLAVLAGLAVLFSGPVPAGVSISMVKAGLGGALFQRQAPVRFLNVGDWGRAGAYNQSLVAYQMSIVGQAIDSQFIISNGDNFYDAGLKAPEDPFFTESFTRIYNYSSLQEQWYAVLGNHDYYGNVLAQLDTHLVNRDPRWSCRRSAMFGKPLCLSSNGAICKDTVDFFFFDTVPMVKSYRTKTKRTLDWRGINTDDWETYNKHQVQELAANLQRSNARWKVVIGHHPVYSFGKHGDQIELIEHVKPVLERYGADVWINGHDHNMQHIKRDDSPVHYFVSGGGSKSFNAVAPEPEEAYGLKFFWEGQGFAAIEVDVHYFKISYYGVFGNLMYSAILRK